jgi:hypothetical protein
MTRIIEEIEVVPDEAAADTEDNVDVGQGNEDVGVIEGAAASDSEAGEPVALEVEIEEVVIEGAEDNAHDSVAIKSIRDALKKAQKRVKELEKQVPAQQNPQALRPKPNIDDEGIDYDPTLFTQALDNWYEEKSMVDFQEREKQRAADSQNQSFQNKVAEFEQSKAQFKQPDFAEMIDLATGTLTETQSAIIIDIAKSPALVKYALGKNPSKLAELSKIDNLVHFTAAVTRLEEQIKMAKKPVTTPEKKITSSTPMASNTLERLRAEAERTGDYTKVVSWKRQNNK